MDLLKDSIAGTATGSSCNKTRSASLPPGDSGALAVALGNLGVVYHELGDAKNASELLELSLKTVLSAVSASDRFDCVYG